MLWVSNKLVLRCHRGQEAKMFTMQTATSKVGIEDSNSEVLSVVVGHRPLPNITNIQRCLQNNLLNDINNSK